MDLVNAHGVFALDPGHLTAPSRMAAFGHCSNAREAMAVATEMTETAEGLSGHKLCRVGDFMDALATRNRRKAK